MGWRLKEKSGIAFNFDLKTAHPLQDNKLEIRKVNLHKHLFDCVTVKYLYQACWSKIYFDLRWLLENLQSPLFLLFINYFMFDLHCSYFSSQNGSKYVLFIYSTATVQSTY